MSRRGKSTETESNKWLQGNAGWELVLTAQYCKCIKMYFLKMVKVVPSFSVNFISTFKTAYTHTESTVVLDSSSSGMD